MSETKTYQAQSILRSVNGVGQLITTTPILQDFQFKSSLTYSYINDLFSYLQPLEGECIVQFTTPDNSVIIDRNLQGELMIKSNFNYNWQIDNDGNLLLLESR